MSHALQENFIDKKKRYGMQTRMIEFGKFFGV